MTGSRMGFYWKLSKYPFQIYIMKSCFYLWLDQGWDFIENYQNILFQIYIMKLCFHLWLIKDGILLEIIKIYAVNKIATRCNFINRQRVANLLTMWSIPNLYYEILLLSMTGSRMEFYAKIIKIYRFKFMMWNYIFIYDWIKDGILLKIIKIYHSNLYYEIILLFMTGSRMRFY